MGNKKKCCKSYKKKGKACKSCPRMQALSKKDREALLRKYQS